MTKFLSLFFLITKLSTEIQYMVWVSSLVALKPVVAGVGVLAGGAAEGGGRSFHGAQGQGNILKGRNNFNYLPFIFYARE